MPRPDVAAVRRGLRELYDRYPKAFEVVAAELMRDDWRNQLPPIVKGRDGKVIKVTDEASSPPPGWLPVAAGGDDPRAVSPGHPHGLRRPLLLRHMARQSHASSLPSQGTDPVQAQSGIPRVHSGTAPQPGDGGKSYLALRSRRSPSNVAYLPLRNCEGENDALPEPPRAG